MDLSWPIGPSIPSPVLPGVERRLRDSVKWLRALPNYEVGTAKALHLEVDRGTGPTCLATETSPDYIDTHPLPFHPHQMRYRAIWMRDVQMLGQWSAWAEINVG